MCSERGTLGFSPKQIMPKFEQETRSDGFQKRMTPILFFQANANPGSSANFLAVRYSVSIDNSSQDCAWKRERKKISNSDN